MAKNEEMIPEHMHADANKRAVFIDWCCENDIDPAADSAWENWHANGDKDAAANAQIMDDINKYGSSSELHNLRQDVQN